MPTNLLPQVVTLAIQAGNAIMAIYNNPDTAATLTKSDNSPLTIADLASDQVIDAGLTKLSPGWPILSEESAQTDYAERKHWKSFWLVDPLDGTKEFIKRNGEFTVNIALIENGQPVLGVVYAPVLDICYYAAHGVGAFIKRSNQAAQPIKAIRPATNEALKVVASRSHSDERTTALLERIGDHQPISMGSSLKLCLIAEGAAHFYPRLGPTMEWDTAAAHAVVCEAGGIVCDRSGNNLQYNKADLHNPEFFVFEQSNSALMQVIQVKA